MLEVTVSKIESNPWQQRADGVFVRTHELKVTHLRRYLPPEQPLTDAEMLALRQPVPPVYGAIRDHHPGSWPTPMLTPEADAYVRACADEREPRYDFYRTINLAAQFGKRVRDEVAAVFLGKRA